MKVGNGIKPTFEMFDYTFYKSQQTKSKFETQKYFNNFPPLKEKVTTEIADPQVETRLKTTQTGNCRSLQLKL